ARLGHRGARSGTVRGGGLSDVIVGAINYDNGQTDEGGAFVYLGSPTGLGLLPAWTAEGDQISATFGFSVASAGDVNGDGYSDVSVGAENYGNGQTDEWRALVVVGSSEGLAQRPGGDAEAGRS